MEEESSYGSYGEAYEANCARYGREVDLPIVLFKRRCCNLAGQLIHDPAQELRMAVLAPRSPSHPMLSICTTACCIACCIQVIANTMQKQSYPTGQVAKGLVQAPACMGRSSSAPHHGCNAGNILNQTRCKQGGWAIASPRGTAEVDYVDLLFRAIRLWLSSWTSRAVINRDSCRHIGKLKRRW